MRVGKDDWAFKVNSKTGDLTMEVPKKKSYSPKEFDMVAVGLMRFCAPIGLLFDLVLEKATAASKKAGKKA